MPILRTENLCRQFLSGKDTIYAVRDVNISIEPKTLTILRGRSGSGKTTLINLLGALDSPTSGTVYLDDTDISHLNDTKQTQIRKKDMGFVFQSFALMSLLSVYENVEFPLRLLGIPAAQRLQRTEECLKMVGLHKRANHRPAELSGGEQQRVAIARAIANKPKIILADEPTAELDTHMALQVMKILRDLVEHEGVTVIMTTHDPNMMELANVVYTLNDGQITD